MDVGGFRATLFELLRKEISPVPAAEGATSVVGLSEAEEDAVYMAQFKMPKKGRGTMYEYYSNLKRERHAARAAAAAVNEK